MIEHNSGYWIGLCQVYWHIIVWILALSAWNCILIWTELSKHSGRVFILYLLQRNNNNFTSLCIVYFRTWWIMQSLNAFNITVNNALVLISVVSISDAVYIKQKLLNLKFVLVETFHYLSCFLFVFWKRRVWI